MNKSLRAGLISIALIGGLAACTSADEKSGESQAVALNQDEVLAHISGNTEVWRKGGGYYSSDGSLLVKWEGKDGSGNWEVSESGEVCYTVDVFGGSRDCHTYVNDGDTIMLVYQGDSRVAKILEGNQLDSL